MAGQHHHARLRRDRLERGDELESGLVRQPQVHDRVLGGGRFRQGDRIARRVRGPHGKAARFEGPPQHLAQHLIVIDQQQAPAGGFRIFHGGLFSW